MSNPKPRKTVHVSVPVLAATGVVLGVATYAAGVKTGFQLKKLATELQAHQMIVLRLREHNPELVDSTIKNLCDQATGAFNAAN